MSDEQTKANDGPRGPGTISRDRYCSDDQGRYDYSRPFVLGGWRYATEPRVMIRTPANGEPDTSGDLRPPPVGGMPWPTATESDLLPWPPAAYEFEERSEPCDEYDCDGTAYGWYPEPPQVPIGDQVIASGLHYRVSLLPNVRYLPSRNLDAIYFRFDGGEGLVMPMRKAD